MTIKKRQLRTLIFGNNCQRKDRTSLCPANFIAVIQVVFVACLALTSFVPVGHQH